MLRVAFLACLFLPASTAAQNDPSIPLTQYTGQRFVHDVRSASLGMAGAFLPDATPLALVENPARLAESGVVPQLRVTGSGHPNYVGINGISTAHLAASYAVGPAVLGAVVSNQSFGTQTLTDELGESLGEAEFGDGAVAFSAAARFGRPQARLDVGLTGRVSQIRTFSGFGTGSIRRDRATQPSVDVGVIGSVDVIGRQALLKGAITPTLTVSAGYTQRYIGPDFEYGDEEPPGLQPRAASLGTSLQFGADTELNGQRLCAFEIEVAVEAEAELEYTEINPNGAETRGSGVLVGQMRVRDAILGTSADPFVTGQRGVRLTAAETLWVGRGETDEGGLGGRPYGRSAWGVGLSAGGALRLVGALQDRSDLVELGRRFDLTLGYAELGGINGFSGSRLGSLGVAARL